MRLWILCALLFLVVGRPSAAADDSGAPTQRPHISGFLRVEAKGAQYTIAVIENSSEIDPAGYLMAGNLLKLANNWVADQYEARHPDLAREKFEKMRAEGIQLEGASSMIVIFRSDDPHDIVGTLRFAYPDKAGRLPLDRDLGWSHPQKALARAPFHELDFMEGRLQGQVAGPALMGDAVEIKNFVVAPGLEHDIVPTLFYQAEIERLSQRKTRSIAEADLNPAIVRTYGKRPAGGWNDFGVSPGEYLLRCDRSLIPYYKRMGFELVQKQPVAEGDYVMQMSREEWIRMGLNRMKARSGFSLYFDESRGAGSVLGKSRYAIRAMLGVDECVVFLRGNEWINQGPVPAEWLPRPKR